MRAITQPKKVHPKKKFNNEIGVLFLCFLFPAIIEGRQYMYIIAKTKTIPANPPNIVFIFIISFVLILILKYHKSQGVYYGF